MASTHTAVDVSPLLGPRVDTPFMDEVTAELGSAAASDGLGVAEEIPATQPDDTLFDPCALAGHGQSQLDDHLSHTSASPSSAAQLPSTPGSEASPPKPRVFSAVPMVGDAGKALAGMLQEDARPTCMKCGMKTDPFRAQIKSKTTCNAGNQRWVCNSCNRVSACCSRNTAWPPDDFLKMRLEEQHEFYKAAVHTSETGRLTWSKVKALLVSTLKQRKITELKASIHGEYLPLSVWVQRGFDGDRIKRLCTDIKPHTVLGDTYRIDIVHIDESVVQQQVEESLAQKTQNVRKKRKSAAAADAGAAAVDEYDGVDSDSSSSISSRKKKSKKGKKKDTGAADSEKERAKQEKKAQREAEQKAKAEKRAAEQQAAKEKAAISKSNAASQAMASKTSATISPLMEELAKLLKHGSFPKLPCFLQEKIAAAHGSMTEWKKACNDILGKAKKAAEKNTPLATLTFTSADVQKLAKESTATMKDAQKCFAMAEKA